jgi:hypothetical protein
MRTDFQINARRALASAVFAVTFRPSRPVFSRLATAVDAFFGAAELARRVAASVDGF